MHLVFFVVIPVACRGYDGINKRIIARHFSRSFSYRMHLPKVNPVGVRMSRSTKNKSNC